MSRAFVRRATLQDYQGVMDIGIVYNGQDYLPYFYKAFVNDPDYLCYVCVIDQEIIGFGCVLVHDGGRVAQPRAGRVKESQRSKGYMQLMWDQLIKDIADLTSAEVLMYVRGENGINWTTLDPAMELIDSANFYEFSISKSRFLKPRPAVSVNRMYEKDLQALFETTSVCRKLFPSDVISHCYLPFGLHKANIRHIINPNTTVFATFSSSTDNKSKNQPLLLVRPEDISLLTICLHYRAPAGQRCEISIHGNDLEQLDSHVQAHIQHSPSTDDHISMGLYTSVSFPFVAVRKIFTTYGTRDFRFYPEGILRRKLEPRAVKAKY